MLANSVKKVECQRPVKRNLPGYGAAHFFVIWEPGWWRL